MLIRRGDIFYADLGPVVGSEQGGVRPVVVIQNDTGNLHSPTTIVAPMTSRKKTQLPTHVHLWVGRGQNTVLLEQVRTISRTRLINKIGQVSARDMARIERAAKISLGMTPT